jgi:predicted regulator of Ras-like GTPase activity (Roadblock/LC7/MglB family)
MFESLFTSLHAKKLELENVLIVGRDGLIIERMHRLESDELMTAECTSFFTDTDRLSREMDLGTTETLDLKYENKSFSLVRINEEYLVIGVYNSGAISGQIQFWLKQIAKKASSIINQ